MTTKLRTPNFSFTNFNLEFDYDEFYANNGVRYIAYGLETCPTTGRKHHQGFVSFSSARTISATAKRMGCSVFNMKGTIEQNEDYCSKESDLVKIGTLPKQGKRTDLEGIQKLIEDGVSERQLATDNFNLWCQYGNRFERYRALLQEKRTWKTKISWFWGPSGCGKSRLAFENDDFVAISFINSFFLLPNGLCPKKAVLDDLVPGSGLDLDTWLKLTDRYQYMMNIKGGSVNCCLEELIITSNYSPEEYFEAVPPASRSACLRRIDRTMNFNTLKSNFDNEVVLGNIDQDLDVDFV